MSVEVRALQGDGLGSLRNLPAQAYFDGKLSSDASLEDALAFLDQTRTDYAVHEQLAIVIHKVGVNLSVL